MLAVSNIGTRLFRFNTALSWVGRVQRQAQPWTTVIQPSDIVIRNARPLHAGQVGMADLGGWTPIVITPAMVGKTMAVSTWIEVKVPGGAKRPEQINFIAEVNKAGGIAFFAESEDQALLFINAFRFNKF
jgi:hypothetical protein